MRISRWSGALVCAVTVATAAALFAAPPTPPKNTTNTAAPKPTLKPINMPAAAQPSIPVLPDRPGIHIASVKVQGNCGQPATFLVDVQNTATTATVAIPSGLFLKAEALSNQSNIPALRPGERRTLTVATPWRTYCQNSETGQPACIEVSVLSDPDLPQFDGVKHRVCENPPVASNPNAPHITDTPHK